MTWPVIKLRRVGAALSLLLVLAGGSAGAQQVQAPLPQVRFTIRAGPDGAITAAAAIGSWLPSVLKNLPVASCAACDPTHLWGVDRGTVGVGASDGPSNVALYATVGGSAMLVALSRHGEPKALNATLEDAAVMAQVAAVDAFATQWLKVLFHRPRPERYTPQGAQFTTVEDSRSFPSGHASFAFAAAAAAASILHRRGVLHDHKLETILLFSGAAATAVLRVVAHRHFPTDVVAGALVGTAIGWAIPMLHPVR